MGHSEARVAPDLIDHVPSDEPANPAAALERERHFVAAWEDRRVPPLSGYLRVRQFRRALAALGAD